MSDKILIVDDEAEIADLVELYLKNENFIVYKFYSAAAALECISNEQLDLAILDIMLPGVSGLEICQKIREQHSYPVIMLTAKNEEIDKITGLTLGADDYITKPFLPLELVARVKAQLRRYKRYNQTGQANDDIITISGLVLNKKTHECMLNGEFCWRSRQQNSPFCTYYAASAAMWSARKNCCTKSGATITTPKTTTPSPSIFDTCARKWATHLKIPSISKPSGASATKFFKILPNLLKY